MGRPKKKKLKLTRCWRCGVKRHIMRAGLCGNCVAGKHVWDGVSSLDLTCKICGIRRVIIRGGKSRGWACQYERGGLVVGLKAPECVPF